jgi:hypothetical protein
MAEFYASLAQATSTSAARSGDRRWVLRLVRASRMDIDNI